MNEKEMIEHIKPKIGEILIFLKNNIDLPPDKLVYKSIIEGKPLNIKTYKEMELFEEPIKLLLSNNRISEKYSKDFVDMKVLDMYHEMLENEDNIDDILQNTVHSLFHMEPSKYQVYSRVENIQIVDDAEYKFIDSTIQLIEKENFPSHFVEETEDSAKEYIFTEVYAGDNRKPEELAVYNFTISLNLIKLYYPYINPVLKGHNIYANQTLLIENLTKKSYGRSRSRPGFSPSKFRLSKEIYEDLKQRGIENLREEKEIVADIKDCLYWYGLAMKERHPSARLLLFVTILEAILKRNGERTELRNTIAERGALFLGLNFKDRKSIKKQLKEIYDERSKVVHRGELLEMEDIPNLAEKYARAILIKLIANLDKLNTKDEFIDYLDDLKLKDGKAFGDD